MASKARRNTVLTILGLLLLGLIAAAAFGKKNDAGVEVIVEPVTVKDFSTTVSASGATEAADAAVVRTAISGQVVEVLVAAGDKVRKGQLLARLDERPYRQVLRQAEDALALARVELEALEDGNAERQRQFDADKSKAERAVISARETLAQARLSLSRMATLHEQGTATDQQLDEAREQVRLAEERLAEAEAARTALTAANARQDLRAAQTRVAQAERSVNAAKEDLAMTTLYAPQAGVVLVRAAEPGVAVVPGAALFTVGTTGRLKVKALVDEAYIVNIRLGQSVSITNEALPGMEFKGTVTAIAPQGQVLDKLALFAVEIAFANQSNAIRPGMTVDCEIDTSRAAGVPVVPLLAVFDGGEAGGGRKFVYVASRGKAVRTYITLGLTGEAEAEVRSGLRGGEQLITGEIDTLRALKDGQAVRIKQAAGAANEG